MLLQPRKNTNRQVCTDKICKRDAIQDGRGKIRIIEHYTERKKRW